VILVTILTRPHPDFTSIVIFRSLISRHGALQGVCHISEKVKLSMSYEYSAINSHPLFALYEKFIVSVEALLLL